MSCFQLEVSQPTQAPKYPHLKSIQLQGRDLPAYSCPSPRHRWGKPPLQEAPPRLPGRAAHHTPNGSPHALPRPRPRPRRAGATADRAGNRPPRAPLRTRRVVAQQQPPQPHPPPSAPGLRPATIATPKQRLRACAPPPPRRLRAGRAAGRGGSSVWQSPVTAERLACPRAERAVSGMAVALQAPRPGSWHLQG